MSGAYALQFASAEDLLESLCDLCDDQLERQETALALCRAHGEALRTKNVSLIEVKTKALDLLIHETVEAEARRIELLRDVVQRYGLPEECTTLSSLVRGISDPWRQRLLDFQEQLRCVLEETRSVVRANASLLRTSIRVVDKALHVFENTAGTSTEVSSGYSPQGNSGMRRPWTPTFLDQKG